MNNLEFKRAEAIKFKGSITHILKCFADGIGFIHRDEFLEIVCEGNKVKIEKMKEKIPSSYIRRFNVNGNEEIFMDRLSMFYILTHIDDYDLFWRFISQIRNPKSYSEKLFLDVYPEIIKKANKWSTVNEKVSELNKLQQDLLHKLENCDLNDDELFELTKKLKEVRIERRKFKNELSNLQTCKDIISNCSFTTEDINNIKEQSAKNEYCLENKIYNARSNEEIICKYGCEEILR